MKTAFVLCLAAATPAVASETTILVETTSLVERTLAGGDLEADTRYLCDRIGGRLTGSAAAERSIAWAVERLTQAGLNVKTEAFDMPALWRPGPADAALISPESFDLPAVAAPQSVATAGDGIEGPVVSAGTGRPDDFTGLPPGAIALVSTPELLTIGDLFAEYMRDRAMLEAARARGIAGILLMSTRPRGLLYRHPVTLDATLSPMPVALVAREPAQRLLRIVREQTAGTGAAAPRARLSVRSGVTTPASSRNVVAEIRGREAPEEVVLLGAHLDSFDLGTGAEDNGVNVALVIEAARQMRRLSAPPRRTVRFLLFTGEEQGLWGSRGYVSRHLAEMDRHVAAVIFDIGSGETEGFYLNGRPELMEAVDRALLPVARLGPFTHSNEAIDGTDNLDFLLAGVPNLVAKQNIPPFLPDYHAASDTIDRVDFQRARENAAIAAALVWGMAESKDRPAPVQTREQVARLIEASGLEPQMKAFGQWKDWAEGKRPGPSPGKGAAP